MPQTQNKSTAGSATPKKKKKRRPRVRTKSCAKCHTPCTTITRCTLRPGGLILIQGYGPKQLEYGTGGPKVAENLYTEALMRDRKTDESSTAIMA